MTQETSYEDELNNLQSPNQDLPPINPEWKGDNTPCPKGFVFLLLPRGPGDSEAIYRIQGKELREIPVRIADWLVVNYLVKDDWLSCFWRDHRATPPEDLTPRQLERMYTGIKDFNVVYKYLPPPTKDFLSLRTSRKLP